MKKSLLILGFVFFAVSMQAGAATLNWVDVAGGSIEHDFSSTITASKGFDSASGGETFNFIFSLSDAATINSLALEFVDNQMEISSVKLLTNDANFAFSTAGPFGSWTLGNTALLAGSHTISVAVASAISGGQFDIKVSSVPVPAAIWLFGSAMMGLVGFSRRKNNSAVSVA